MSFLLVDRFHVSGGGKVYPKLDRIVELASFDESSENLEKPSERQEANIVNRLVATKLQSVHIINVNVEDSLYPSIDDGNLEVADDDRPVFRRRIANPKITKDWKRDKTYNGSPIYRVILKHNINRIVRKQFYLIPKSAIF